MLPNIGRGNCLHKKSVVTYPTPRLKIIRPTCEVFKCFRFTMRLHANARVNSTVIFINITKTSLYIYITKTETLTVTVSE